MEFTKKRRIRVNHELKEQRYLVRWLKEQQLYGRVVKFTSIPNSTYTTSWKQINDIQASGMNRGFPDMVILLKEKLVLLELKRAKIIKANGEKGASPSTVADEQYEWIRLLNAYPGCYAVIAYGWKEAVEVLTKLIGDVSTPKETQQEADKRSNDFDTFLKGPA
jgi:hypothetical protein